jgi:hypothetical protein
VAAAIAALLSAPLAAVESEPAFIGIAGGNGSIRAVAAWSAGQWFATGQVPPRTETLLLDRELAIAWTGVSRPERFVSISEVDRRAVLETSRADLLRAEDSAVRDFNARNAAQGIRFPATDAERHRALPELQIGVRSGAADGFTYTYVEWIKRFASPAITRLRATVRERQGFRATQVEAEAEADQPDRGPMRPLAAFRHEHRIYWLVYRQPGGAARTYDLAIVESGVPRALRLAGL